MGLHSLCVLVMPSYILRGLGPCICYVNMKKISASVRQTRVGQP